MLLFKMSECYWGPRNCPTILNYILSTRVNLDFQWSPSYADFLQVKKKTVQLTWQIQSEATLPL